ncbi:MAG: ketoacyl-ACP synthase III [Planctomycetota bacterium]
MSSPKVDHVQQSDVAVGIVAINHAAPPTIETAEQLAPRIGKSPDWIVENAGVACRHTALPGEDPAELVADVAKPLLDQCGSPDLILNAGAMHRQMVPDTSVFIARSLGVEEVPAFTINATCLSFVVALNTAKSLIRSGDYQCVLICTAEFPSRGRNFNQPESAALLGDGVAAAIVEAGASTGHIESFRMKTWPEAADYAEVRGGGVMRRPWDETTTHEDHVFDMKGDRLLRFALPRIRPFVRQFLQDNDLSVSDLAAIVPHQASLSAMQIVSKLGFPKDKIVDVLAKYGNCVAASIPIALSEGAQQGKFQRGDRILLLGTAAGMSIGAAILRW